MDFSVPIEGISVEVRRNLLVVRSERPLKTLSSAVFNGGLREANIIVNCQVPKDYDHADPKGYLRCAIREAGFPLDKAVGMMTAVNIRNAAIATKRHGDLTVSSIVTAGLTNAIRVGEIIFEKKVGTINVILLIDGDLTGGCMVDALKTAVEAKTVALRELDVRSSVSFEPASGTSTDSIVVACTGRGRKFKYAGTATEIGGLIGKSIIEAVKDAIRRQDGIISNRPLINRLMERGITLDDLMDAALELFQPHPGIETREKAIRMLRKGFEEALSDVNVAALVISGLRLEEDGRYGLIPGLRGEIFRGDPLFLLADEILGMAIANYIAGTRGLFEFVRFDKMKPGILKRLGPVLDDVICGIIAGVSSNAYSVALEKE